MELVFQPNQIKVYYVDYQVLRGCYMNILFSEEPFELI